MRGLLPETLKENPGHTSVLNKDIITDLDFFLICKGAGPQGPLWGPCVWGALKAQGPSGALVPGLSCLLRVQNPSNTPHWGAFHGKKLRAPRRGGWAAGAPWAPAKTRMGGWAPGAPVGALSIKKKVELNSLNIDSQMSKIDSQMPQIDSHGHKTKSQMPESESLKPIIDSLRTKLTPRDPNLTPRFPNWTARGQKSTYRAQK